MSAILAAVLQWMTYSTWWKKYGGQAGALCAGILIALLAGDRIRAVFLAFGVSQNELQNFLLAVASAGGIGMSHWLSLRKAKLDAGKPDATTP